jgi:hypothetical protein
VSAADERAGVSQIETVLQNSGDQIFVAESKS